MATPNTGITDTEHPTNPTASQDYDTTIIDHDYNRRLKDAIYETFIHHVTDPCKLMRLLQKYNRNVLTVDDISYIRNYEKYNGFMAANKELLDRLPAYKGWFQCLLQAVNSEHINLGFLQKEFQDLKDDLDNQYLSENDEVMTGTQSFDTGNRTPSSSQRRENVRMKITIERLTKQMRESNDAHRELKQELKQEVTQQKRANEGLTKQLKDLNDAHKELQQELVPLKLEVSQQKRENERLTKQMKDINDAHKELQQVVMPLKQAVSQLKNENATQQEMTTLTQKVSQLEINNALQQEEVMTLTEKMSQLENNKAIKQEKVKTPSQNDSQTNKKNEEDIVSRILTKVQNHLKGRFRAYARNSQLSRTL